MCACLHMCLLVHVHSSIRACMLERACTCAHVHLRVHMYVMSVYISTHMYMFTYVRVYIHICSHFTSTSHQQSRLLKLFLKSQMHCVRTFMCDMHERWGPGVETQKNVRGEIGGWGRVPFNEPYAPSLSTTTGRRAH